MKKQIILDYDEYKDLIKEIDYAKEKMSALIDTIKDIDGMDDYKEIHERIMKLNKEYPMWL